MPEPPNYKAEYAFAFKVFGCYARLLPTQHGKPLSSLGGNLLYAEKLDEEGRALVTAANIAGAASLSATDNPEAQRQAIRDGVVDFMVTSLDEALRILKNEIRKRETVAVCVALSPHTLQREMQERGVLPDLLRTDLDGGKHEVEATRVAAEDEPGPTPSMTWVAWSVNSAPARWLPRLDAIALDCLESDAESVRRWVRLAPRYLGRLAKSVHLLGHDREFAAAFIEHVRTCVESREIAVPVNIRVSSRESECEYRFAAPDTSVLD